MDVRIDQGKGIWVGFGESNRRMVNVASVLIPAPFSSFMFDPVQLRITWNTPDGFSPCKGLREAV